MQTALGRELVGMGYRSRQSNRTAIAFCALARRSVATANRIIWARCTILGVADNYSDPISAILFWQAMPRAAAIAAPAIPSKRLLRASSSRSFSAALAVKSCI